MPWIYRQSTGELSHEGGRPIAVGYSGAPEARNNPSLENERDRGPIPRGSYRIEPFQDSIRVGPRALPLTPIGHDALGRTDFMIHGDSRSEPGNASHGCVILPRDVRVRMYDSGDRVLEVVP